MEGYEGIGAQEARLCRSMELLPRPKVKVTSRPNNLPNYTWLVRSLEEVPLFAEVILCGAM